MTFISAYEDWSPRERRVTLIPMSKTLLAHALLVAALVGACSAPEPDRTGTPHFDAARAWSDLEKIVAFGPRPSGSAANASLRDFLSDELEALGLSVTREPFTAATPAGDIDFENVYTDLAPATPGAPWILLCTHFDTKRLPGNFVGANDGGSGTAVLLELARALVRDTRPRELGIRILFIDGEEAINVDWEGDDNTYGSRYHARQLMSQGRAREFGACILLDMIGDADLGILHETYSRRELMELFESEATRLGLGKYMRPRRWLPVKDDHLSFASIGIPSVDLIDFDYGPNNAYWHTTEDTLDKCSAHSLGVAGHLVLGALPAVERWVLEL